MKYAPCNDNRWEIAHPGHSYSPSPITFVELSEVIDGDHSDTARFFAHNFTKPLTIAILENVMVEACHSCCDSDSPCLARSDGNVSKESLPRALSK